MKSKLKAHAACAGVMWIAALCSARAQPAIDFAALAHATGTPDIPGLKVVWLAPWGDPAKANRWQNIIAHQTEGPAGSARGGAQEQFKNPTRRGVTVWVETDGTVYWAAAENLIPTHGEGGDRNDNKYIDNGTTYHQVVKTNTIGVEFAGNYPDVTAPPTAGAVCRLGHSRARAAGAVSHPKRPHLRAQLDRLQRQALLRGLRARDPCACAEIRSGQR